MSLQFENGPATIEGASGFERLRFRNENASLGSLGRSLLHFLRNSYVESWQDQQHEQG
jgi:hypothetical protein